MNIIEAIQQSKLGVYQKAIDKCNHNKGCNAYCSNDKQATCHKLKQHSDELHNLKYDNKTY